MLNKPHIVHIQKFIGGGGIDQLIFYLVTHPKLQYFKHSIICISPEQSQFRKIFQEVHNQNYKKFQNIGISIYYCPIFWPIFTFIPSYRINRWLRNKLIFTFYLRFPLLLKLIKADLIHTHVTKYIDIQAKVVIHKVKLPFVWTIHGLYRSRGEEDAGWLTAFNLIKQSDRTVITAVSHAALMDVLGERKMPEGKARVIYNGIDLSRFGSNRGQIRVLRKQWAIPDDAVIFGSVGWLIPIKRYDLLLGAGAQIIKRHPNVHIVIAGEGPMRWALEEQAKRLGIQDHVHLIGYQSDIVQFWREVDVAVICSDSESFSMALLEACASGVACIATKVGGIPEVLTDDSGILVEAGSLEGLVDAMERMMDSKVRAEYGRRAREVAERFSMDKIAAQYDALYRELLGI